MVKSAPGTTKPEFDLAEKRGNRVEKLFKGIKTDTMYDIIKALKQEELHLANPVVEESGKQDFFKACMEVIPDGLFSTALPGPQGKADIDTQKAFFIEDLWKETLASRRAQETRPCW